VSLENAGRCGRSQLQLQQPSNTPSVVSQCKTGLIVNKGDLHDQPQEEQQRCPDESQRAADKKFVHIYAAPTSTIQNKQKQIRRFSGLPPLFLSGSGGWVGLAICARMDIK
jgi:hypothetical protein